MKKVKIFVTVGSTKFDELVKAVDSIVGEVNNLSAQFQIGRGDYKPKNGKWFRYDPQIGKYFKWSDVIVCIDSAGTILENLELGKKVIAVKNWHTIGSRDISKKLSEEGYIKYLDVNSEKELKVKLKKILTSKLELKRYKKPKCEIHERIIEFLGGENGHTRD